MMTEQNLIALASQLIEIARKAGRAIMTVYQQEDLNIRTKDDATPVTNADIAANEVIEQSLTELSLQYPMLCEETVHAPWSERQRWERYWLVDPLDGTKEFINRNGEFSVNIALVEDHYPLLGVVHIPVTDTTYWGGLNLGGYRQVADNPYAPINTRPLNPEQEVIVLGSRSYANSESHRYLEALRTAFPTLRLKKLGSALKSCQIAAGEADIYPRLGPTSEWDTAAVQGVVEGAGGLFLDPTGQRFSYNRKASLTNSNFLVLGDPAAHWAEFWPPSR